MSKHLIIVESPAKVKTIRKFLGKNYAVEASVGHVRDLPTRELGVDESKNFTPHYQIISGKEKVVGKLRKAAASADHVFLAPDPDREGEAIAWHIAELINKDNTNISRIQFNEITASAVKEALEHPKPLDENLFDSQQARRVLDRLVGYKISPILWKTVKRGISAGRVQSVALKIIVEREKERRIFQPEEYWNFKILTLGPNPPDFWLDLWKRGNKSVKVNVNPVRTQEEAETLDKQLRQAEFIVDNVEEKQRKRNPPPPYITSTLQQDANRRMGYSAKRTMSVAQRLYEGVELGSRGITALITYMRTDSFRIAKEAQTAAKSFILDKYGKDYYPAKARAYRSKGSAQDAHEAIRPIDVTLTPADVHEFLPRDQLRIYTMIWQRFVASQMASATFWDTVVLAKASLPDCDTLWRAKGERLLFPGFLAALDRADTQDSELPKLAAGDSLTLKDLTKEQKFTQPPPRYSEASLVKELEEQGIGRPSTYASIISTLLDREYARLEEKRLVPSELGFIVSDQLSEHFTSLMDVGFTADMETKLDDVALGKQNWSDLIKTFASEFYPVLTNAQKAMAKAILETPIKCTECGKPMLIKFGRTGEFLGCSGYPGCKSIQNFTRDEQGNIVVQERRENIESGVTCEHCGKPMVFKSSSRGEFLGCSGYPDCRNILNFTRNDDGSINVTKPEEPEVVGKCPSCGSDLVVKRARTGSRFIACTGYPKCKHIEPFSTGIACPMEECDGELVEKSSRRGKLFYSCSRYPACKYALWDLPVPGPCPDCGFPILTRKSTKAKGEFLACPQKTCSYTAPLPEEQEE